MATETIFTRENVLNGVPTLRQDVILLPEGARNLNMSSSCEKPKEVCVCVCVCVCVVVVVGGCPGLCGRRAVFLPS